MTDKQSLITKFFNHLGIDEDNISISQEEDGLKIDVDLKESQRGIYIGYHAATLDSLQYLLSLMINNQQDNPQRILLDIGGYRARRLENITEVVDKIKQAVISSGTPRSISRLSPTERRQVHVMLSKDDSLITYSQGEGQDRKLYIAPKT